MVLQVQQDPQHLAHRQKHSGSPGEHPVILCTQWYNVPMSLRNIGFSLMISCTVLVGFWLWFKIGMLLAEAFQEAKTHNKKIEFGQFLFAGLGLLIALGSLVYTFFTQNSMNTRISNLENQKNATVSATPSSSLPN